MDTDHLARRRARPDEVDTVHFRGSPSGEMSPSEEFARLPKGPSFREQDLTGAGFEAVENAENLVKADFTGSNLENANLDGKSLNGAIFNGANLANVTFAYSHLDDARFRPDNGRPADMTGCFMQSTKLSRADFSHVKLDNAQFLDCEGFMPRFTQASLTGATFVQSRFRQADFSGADLSLANIGSSCVFNDPQAVGRFTLGKEHAIRQSATKFKQAVLGKTDLMGGQLQGADFTGADLSGRTSQTAPEPAIVWNTQLQYADFTQADLRGVLDSALYMQRFNKPRREGNPSQFQHALFHNTLLSQAEFNWLNSPENLRGARFHGAVLDAANFEHMQLRDVQFSNDAIADGIGNPTVLTDARMSKLGADGLDFRRAVMSRCQLNDASLRKARLQNAQLDQSNLSQANLQDAQLRGASLKGANLRGAQLQGTDLRNVVLDAGTILTGAVYDRTTRFPEGFQIPADMVYERSLRERLPGARQPQRPDWGSLEAMPDASGFHPDLYRPD